MIKRALASLLFLFPLAAGISAQDDKSVIDFYLDGLDSVISNSRIFRDSMTYEATVESIYQDIDYRGRLSREDTAIYEGVFTGGRLDTSNVIDSAKINENTIPPNINFARPWKMNCSFFFYPNDTGAGNLAIGFESNDIEDPNILSGIIIMNRKDYRPVSIYMYFAKFGDINHYSKQIHFVNDETGIAIRKIILQGSISRLFLRRYFRQDLIFSGYSFEPE
jgi:hypothetical protein